MVLEVVSRSSVEKDTEVLRAGLRPAGVREYWLVDARAEPLRFDILRPGPGRLQGRPQARRVGALRGLRARFRLTRQPGEDGYPEFTLEVQPEKPA